MRLTVSQPQVSHPNAARLYLGTRARLRLDQWEWLAAVNRYGFTSRVIPLLKNESHRLVTVAMHIFLMRRRKYRWARGIAEYVSSVAVALCHRAILVFTACPIAWPELSISPTTIYLCLLVQSPAQMICSTLFLVSTPSQPLHAALISHKSMRFHHRHYYLSAPLDRPKSL